LWKQKKAKFDLSIITLSCLLSIKSQKYSKVKLLKMKINTILLINALLFSFCTASAQAQYQSPSSPTQPNSVPPIQNTPPTQPNSPPPIQPPAGGVPQNSYPSSAVNAYMEGCVNGALQDPSAGISQAQAQGFCSCTINEFQNRYTFEQFVDLSQTYKSDPQKQKEFQEVVYSCIGALQTK